MERILIIDDNKDYADSIKMILASAKYPPAVPLQRDTDGDTGPYSAKAERPMYNVDIANSSDEAAKKLEAEAPDLIILDVMMQKGAEGIIISRKLKKDARLNKVPVLMLTSISKQTGFRFIEKDPRDKTFLPVEEFMEKPVAPDVLLAKIKTMLEGKK